MNKRILHLAIPSIVSNITVPLLGLVDMAIVGHLPYTFQIGDFQLGAAPYIGAIAVGGMLFNILYWLFGFLRMGTSGMTSQALGGRDLAEVTRILFRSIGVGWGVAFLLVVLQYPVQKGAFALLDTSVEVEALAILYFRICIWGAPAILGLYGLTGWFIGMQNSRFPMFIALAQNVVNIGASLLLVYVFDLKMAGVAAGTLIAQYSGLLMAFGLWLKFYKRHAVSVHWAELLNRIAMERFFRINRDIFFRTLCLVAVTTFFTSIGARQGNLVLAVNTLLMQLFTLFSYIMDGFAYAGEALAGRYIGARNYVGLQQMVRRLFGWGIGVAVFFTLLYGGGGKAFLSFLTDDVAVVREADLYFYWVLAIPFAGFAAFLWDGILIGATATRLMLYSMLIAAGLFFLIYYCGMSLWGNHALWMAFLFYLFMRGFVQGILWSRWRKKELIEYDT